MKLITEIEILKAKNTTKSTFFKDVEVGDKLILESNLMYLYGSPYRVTIYNQRTSKEKNDFAGNIHRNLDANFRYKINKVCYDVEEIGMGGN